MSFQVLETPFGQICLGGDIHRLMAEAIGEINPVSKSAANKEQGYSYRPMTEVLNHANSVLAKKGISVVQLNVHTETDELIEIKKKDYVQYMRREVLLVTYMFTAPDGSFKLAQSKGTGQDFGDKATNKALTFAFKNLLINTFLIPTNEPDPDGETMPQGAKATQKQATKQPSKQPVPAGQQLLNQSDQVAYEDWCKVIVQAKDDIDLNSCLFDVKNIADSPLKKAVGAALQAQAKKLGLVFNKESGLYTDPNEEGF